MKNIIIFATLIGFLCFCNYITIHDSNSDATSNKYNQATSNNNYEIQSLTKEQYDSIENQVDACFDGTGPCKQEWLDARDGKI